METADILFKVLPNAIVLYKNNDKGSQWLVKQFGHAPDDGVYLPPDDLVGLSKVIKEDGIKAELDIRKPPQEPSFDIVHASEFAHTTLKLYPESRLEDGTWTPKRAGITLLDEDAEHTGIYIHDKEGGLYPARTVDLKASNYETCINAWCNSEYGDVVDKRTKKQISGVIVDAQ